SAAKTKKVHPAGTGGTYFRPRTRSNDQPEVVVFLRSGEIQKPLRPKVVSRRNELFFYSQPQKEMSTLQERVVLTSGRARAIMTNRKWWLSPFDRGKFRSRLGIRRSAMEEQKTIQ
ncbi:hypothetical protein BaRGS_00020921, partial [Batillaria attramentaria]